MDVITENKVIPKLRFKEFQDDWKLEKIKNITSINAGGTPSTLKVEYWNGEIPWMNSGELNLKRVYDVKNRITELGLKNSSTRLIPKECILIGLAGQGKTRGTAAVNYISLCTNQSIAAIYPNESFNTEFIYQNIDSRYKELRRLSTGDGGRGGLNLSIIGGFGVPLPSLTEQQKIASFLSAVDEKLQQLTQKKELLKEYKKGVMQKIFSQELCFKDDNGNDYPDWEEKKLGEVLIERKEMSLKSEGLEHISLTTKGVIPKSKRYMRDFLVNDDSTKKYKVTRLNDICYNPANLKFGVICRNKYGDGIFSPIYVTFEVSKSDTVFMEYFLVRSDFISKARKYEEGTVYERMAVKPSDFISLLVCLPSLEEQKKIAKFLSILDRKIKLVSTQIENTKDFKKGLLQQMFV